MNIPKELRYTKSHEWVLITEEGTARIGLTDFAQAAMGDIVYTNLPLIGDFVSKEEVFGDVESVKAVSDIYSPISGEIIAVNDSIIDAPERINQDPYGSWLIEVCDISEDEDLLDSDEYEAFCEEET